jgi:hypothetical protein
MSVDTRHRTYDWEDQEATLVAGLHQDGLAVLHAIGAGTLPLPPAVKTLGIEPGEAGPGRVAFHLDVAQYHSTRSASSTAASWRRCWTRPWDAQSTRCFLRRSGMSQGR